jgi:hypothetical protein
MREVETQEGNDKKEKAFGYKAMRGVKPQVVLLVDFVQE